MKRNRLFGVLAVAALPLIPPGAVASDATGVVHAIERAPVVSNGDVAGKPLDYVIEFDRSSDPTVRGRSLLAGHQIRIAFPPEIDLGAVDPNYPVADVPTPGLCTPGNLLCTTAVLLKGWPQNPVFPPAAFHRVAIDTQRNEFVVTAVQDILPAGEEDPGIKGIHLIFNGISNPKPGAYRVSVAYQTGAEQWDRGSGLLRVRKHIRAAIHDTGAFARSLAEGSCAGTLPPNPNSIYQSAGPRSAAPLRWTFLLWDANGEPIENTSVQRISRSYWWLKQDGYPIGIVRVQAPRGAKGFALTIDSTGCPSVLPAAPIIGATPGIGPQPVGRLDLRFYTGDRPGPYIATLRLFGGNEVRRVVEVAR
ncbi:MAG: hypothetical protein AAGI15_03010 [Pseudomonadota bacterium]